MKSKYKRLGQYIRQVDVRNTEGKEENLLGVSVQKKFIPSIANTVGTDFTKYKVVKKGQFTYIPDTSRRGDKIGIALLEDYEEGLVSNVYTVFEVIDEKQLIPQYLMLWFSRPEFDRFARFKSHGSVREVMDWDEMCNVELPVPTYEEQIRIVESYKTITDRIALKQQINVYITSSECSLSKAGADSQKNKYIPENTVVVACIGANAGEVALTSYIAQTNQQINAIISKYPCFLYFSIKAHTVELRTLGEGSSTMININKTSFENYEIPTPSDNTLQQLEHKLNIIFSAILHNLQEIDRLNETKDLLVTQLSR